jgi:hypothetical protein
LAKNYRRVYESFQDVVENGLDGRTTRKVAHNTYLQRRTWDNLTDEISSVALLVHSTDVLTFTPEGIEYHDGGWQSKLTRDRMNDFGPITVRQKNYEWWCSYREWNAEEREWQWSEEWPYFNGMVVSYAGVLINALELARL